jgi:hypothetical protein
VAQIRQDAPVSVVSVSEPARQTSKSKARRSVTPKKSLVKHSKPQRGKRGLLYVKD